jgi:hypothetical protein
VQFKLFWVKSGPGTPYMASAKRLWLWRSQIAIARDASQAVPVILSSHSLL